MELFKYYTKNGDLCTVHTRYCPDTFDREWFLMIDHKPYGYYKREQDAKSAGTKLKKKLIENGYDIVPIRYSEKWRNYNGYLYIC